MAVLAGTSGEVREPTRRGARRLADQLTIREEHDDPMPKQPKNTMAAAEAWLRRLGFGYERPSPHQLKVGKVNFYPSTGTIQVDGEPARRPETGLPEFQRLIEGMLRNRRRGGAAAAAWPPSAAAPAKSPGPDALGGAFAGPEQGPTKAVRAAERRRSAGFEIPATRGGAPPGALRADRDVVVLAVDPERRRWFERLVAGSNGRPLILKVVVGAVGPELVHVSRAESKPGGSPKRPGLG